MADTRRFMTPLLTRDDELDPDRSRGVAGDGPRLGEWLSSCEGGREEAGDGGAGRDDCSADTESERGLVLAVGDSVSNGLADSG